MVKQRSHKASVVGSIPTLTTKTARVAQLSEYPLGTGDVASVNLALRTKTIGRLWATDRELQIL